MTLAWQRLRRGGRDQSGSVLVITAVMLVVFIGLAALAIDVGSFYQAQRHAQSAADAAALAALNDLPASTTAATSDINSYVSANYPGATATESYPSSSTVKVTVSATTPSFFGQIFGLTSAQVSASASAGYPPGTAPAALFAMDSTCSGTGILIDGNNTVVPGSVVSNGSLSVQSNNNVLGLTTYGGPNNCSASVNGGPNSFNGSSAPTASRTLNPWPLDYTRAPLAPTCDPSHTSAGTGTVYTMGTAGANTPGIYCATNGTISIPANTDLEGYTLEANAFVIGGNTITVTPAANGNGLSLYETGTSLLDINGNSFSTQTIFAPNATVKVDSNDTTIGGFIEAKDVWVHGNNLTINGTGPPSQGFTGALTG